MDDTQKMLKAIINGQTALKQELVGRIDKLEDKMEKFRLEVKQEFKKTNSRIDKVGNCLSGR